MDAGTGTGVIWAVVMIVVLVSSLAARRMPIGQTLKYVLAWLAIFVGLYGLVLFRDDLARVWDRARADLGGASQAHVRGTQTVIQRSEDGHFWVEGRVGGKAVEFLIDSGATTTSLTAKAADDLGLAVDRSGYPMVVMTANGPIENWPTELPDLEVGSISTSELNVLVSDVPDSVNLLGMNWLSQLKSWRVEGSEMVLEP
jgi:aspartyl protease family protein